MLYLSIDGEEKKKKLGYQMGPKYQNKKSLFSSLTVLVIQLNVSLWVFNFAVGVHK